MPHWEYDKIDLNDVPARIDELDLLNEVGKDGWELVAITPSNIAYVKRPLDAEPAEVAPPPVPVTRRKAAPTRTRQG